MVSKEVPCTVVESLLTRCCDDHQGSSRISLVEELVISRLEGCPTYASYGSTTDMQINPSSKTRLKSTETDHAMKHEVIKHESSTLRKQVEEQRRKYAYELEQMRLEINTLHRQREDYVRSTEVACLASDAAKQAALHATERLESLTREVETLKMEVEDLERAKQARQEAYTEEQNRICNRLHEELQREKEALQSCREADMEQLHKERAVLSAIKSATSEKARKLEEEAKTRREQEKDFYARIQQIELQLAQREHDLNEREECIIAVESLAAQLRVREANLVKLEEDAGKRQLAVEKAQTEAEAKLQGAEVLRQKAQEESLRLVDQQRSFEERRSIINKDFEMRENLLTEREAELKIQQEQLMEDRALAQGELKKLAVAAYQVEAEQQSRLEKLAGLRDEALLLDQEIQKLHQLRELSAQQASESEQAAREALRGGHEEVLKLRHTYDGLVKDISSLSRKREELVTCINHEREEWGQQQKVEAEQMQVVREASCAEHQRLKEEFDQVVERQEARMKQWEDSLEGLQQELSQQKNYLCEEEKRLTVLSEELESRERDISGIREQLSHDLTVAQEAARAAALERAELKRQLKAVYEKEVALERWKEQVVAENLRRLQEKETTLAGWHARLEERQMDFEQLHQTMQSSLADKEKELELWERTLADERMAMEEKSKGLEGLGEKLQKEHDDKLQGLRQWETELKAVDILSVQKQQELEHQKQSIVNDHMMLDVVRAEVNSKDAEARRLRHEAELIKDDVNHLHQRLQARETRVAQTERELAERERALLSKQTELSEALELARNREAQALEQERLAQLACAAATEMQRKAELEQNHLEKQAATVAEQEAVAKRLMEEATKQRKAVEILGKSLNMVDEALVAGEAKLRASWHSLHCHIADVAGDEELIKVTCADPLVTSTCWKSSTALIFDSDALPEEVLAMLEVRRAALVERESAIQCWVVAVELHGARLRAIEKYIKGNEESLKQSSDELSMDSLQLSEKKKEMDHLAKHLSFERQQLAKLADHLQARSVQLEESESSHQEALADLHALQAAVDIKQAEAKEQIMLADRKLQEASALSEDARHTLRELDMREAQLCQQKHDLDDLQKKLSTRIVEVEQEALAYKDVQQQLALLASEKSRIDTLIQNVDNQQDHVRERIRRIDQREAEQAAEARRLAAELTQVEVKLKETDRLARLEIELSSREAECKIKEQQVMCAVHEHELVMAKLVAAEDRLTKEKAFVREKEEELVAEKQLLEALRQECTQQQQALMKESQNVMRKQEEVEQQQIVLAERQAALATDRIHLAQEQQELKNMMDKLELAKASHQQDVQRFASEREQLEQHTNTIRYKADMQIRLCQKDLDEQAAMLGEKQAAVEEKSKQLELQEVQFKQQQSEHLIRVSFQQQEIDARYEYIQQSEATLQTRKEEVDVVRRELDNNKAHVESALLQAQAVKNMASQQLEAYNSQLKSLEAKKASLTQQEGEFRARYKRALADLNDLEHKVRVSLESKRQVVEELLNHILADVEEQQADLHRREQVLSAELTAATGALHAELKGARLKLESQLGIYEVKAKAELELKSRLLEAGLEDLRMRENRANEREANLGEMEKEIRDYARNAKEELIQESLEVKETEAQLLAQKQELDQLTEELEAQRAAVAHQQNTLTQWSHQLKVREEELNFLGKEVSNNLQQARQATSAVLEKKQQALQAVAEAHAQRTQVEAKLDASKIRLQEERSSWETSKAGLQREQAAMEEQRAALMLLKQQLEQREESVAAGESKLEELRCQMHHAQQELAHKAEMLAQAAAQGQAQARYIEAEKELINSSQPMWTELAARESCMRIEHEILQGQQAMLDQERKNLQEMQDVLLEQQRHLADQQAKQRCEAASLEHKEVELTCREQGLGISQLQLEERDSQLRLREQELRSRESNLEQQRLVLDVEKTKIQAAQEAAQESGSQHPTLEEEQQTLAEKQTQLDVMRAELEQQLYQGAVDLDRRENALKQAEEKLAVHKEYIAQVEAKESALQSKEAELNAIQWQLEKEAELLSRTRDALARDRQELQDRDAGLSTTEQIMESKMQQLAQKAADMEQQRMELEGEVAKTRLDDSALVLPVPATTSLLTSEPMGPQASALLGAPKVLISTSLHSRPILPAEPSDDGVSFAPGTQGLSAHQQRTVTTLLASLQHNAQKGSERLQRLQRILDTISADANDSTLVEQSYSTLTQLDKELRELQEANLKLATLLQVAGSKAQLQNIKQQLEEHQHTLARWEENVRVQLEVITQLQDPTKRISLSSFRSGKAAASLKGLAPGTIWSPPSPAK